MRRRRADIVHAPASQIDARAPAEAPPKPWGFLLERWMAAGREAGGVTLPISSSFGRRPRRQERNPSKLRRYRQINKTALYAQKVRLRILLSFNVRGGFFDKTVRRPPGPRRVGRIDPPRVGDSSRYCFPTSEPHPCPKPPPLRRPSTTAPPSSESASNDAHRRC